jgi:hypothetical protein
MVWLAMSVPGGSPFFKIHARHIFDSVLHGIRGTSMS